MVKAIAVWAGVAALCGVSGTLVALRRRYAARFCRMSIAGRGFLWSSAGGFITAMVLANAAIGEDVLLPTLAVSAGLLVVGLVLYALGQKSDGSAAWHDELEARARAEAEFARSQGEHDGR